MARYISEIGPSNIACHSCRRRKVKCDRQLPQCRVCIQTDQTCKYPARSMKPGPKIGSTQRSRKRSQGDVAQKDHDPRSPSDSPNLRSHQEPTEEVDDEISHLRSQSSTKLPRNRGNDFGLAQNDCDRRESQISMHDLSFILHPSHEASSPEKEQCLSRNDKINQQQHTLFQQASQALALSQPMLDLLLRVYFDNMVAINVFHEPTFGTKLGAITSSAQICALLSAMLGYAARFYPSELERNNNDGTQPMYRVDLPGSDHFLEIAFKFIDEALDECGDDQPPLCILQALIVAAHCQLTRGVHGRAWRSLGRCVRLAYELNLHLVDAPNTGQLEPEDPVQWRDNEEKRRAWWAIWEMDVFASTIRRTPTAVNWAQMEVLLPVDDSDWFQDRPAPSSFLESDASQRWKSTQDAGNQSPKAWFLIINSIMKDAQLITSPHGVPCHARQDLPQYRGSTCRLKSNSNTIDEARHKLEILANSVQCFVMALPQHLRYRSQYLSFDSQSLGQQSSSKQIHCGIYNIFVMTQLTRLMIHRHELFASNTLSRQGSGTGPSGPPASDDTIGQLTSHLKDVNNASVRQYFDAADNIFMIVNRSSEDHIKHINPFLLSTIWLASAVLLVRQHYGPPSNLPDLVKSRFDVLYLTYKRCIIFWDSKTAMGQNLEMLERRLEEDRQQQPAGRRQEQSVDQPRGFPNRRTKPCSPWVSELPEGQGRYIRSPVTPQMTNNGRSTVYVASSGGMEPHAGGSAPVENDQNKNPPISRGKHYAGGRQMLDTPPPSVIRDSTSPGQMAWPQARLRMQPMTMQYLKAGQQQQQGQLQESEVNGSELDPGSSIHDFSLISSESEHSHMSMAEMEMPTYINTSPFMGMPNSHGGGLVDLESQGMEWRNIDMPMDVQDLLTGFSTY